MIIKLTIPYENLCPDNQKLAAIIVLLRGKMVARMILTKKYRDAKLKTSLVAQCSYRGKPLETEIELEATLYPPTRRKTDPSNFSKMIHDALQGVVYVNDSQIIKCTYHLGDVSRIDARMEVVINTVEMREAA